PLPRRQHAVPPRRASDLKWTMAHPELEVPGTAVESGGSFHPVYPLTEKLRARHIDSKLFSRLMREVLHQAAGRIRETLPRQLCADRKSTRLNSSHVKISY